MPDYVRRDVDDAEFGIRARIDAAAQRGGFVPQPLLLPAGEGADLQAVGTGVLALSKVNWK